MARKKSVKLAATTFSDVVDEILDFLRMSSTGQSDEHVSWLYNYAVIRLYREFESLMLSALVGAINNDTTTLAQTSGVAFPQHLTDEVCEFLITGTGYFDFRGRSGLIGTLKKFVPDDHYLVTIVKKASYADALDKLSALRNFAAHESSPSKGAVLRALNRQRVASSGTWLKKQNRFDELTNDLKRLASEIAGAAPF